jgi:zinc protease
MKKTKTQMKLILIAMICFVSFSLQAQLKKTASVEGITEYQMNNGLKVLLFPDNSAQTITVNITYLVGSRHEGYGEKGMAHLLEHMVFKGTPNHPDIPKELSSRGARPNGTTYYDRTNYYETFNASDENLDWALDLEADRMVNSFIAKKDLESEFTVVRNEFESGENDPGSVLMDNVINAAYLWHNYGQSTIGNRSDIEKVPIENLKAFYKKFYRPDNAVLMITGKFDLEKTLKLVQDKFGKIEKPTTPLRDSHTEEPPQDGEKWVNLSRVGDLQVVSSMYHIPAGSDEDYAALSVAQDVLKNAPSGRLYKALVESKKASSVWAYSPFTKEPSFLYINVDVPSEKSLDQAQVTLRTVLDDFRTTPVTKEELNRSKATLLKQYDQISRNSAYLGTYMSEFIGAGDFRLAFIHRDRIEAMTLDKVNNAIKKYLIPTNRTVGQFMPTKTPERVAIKHTEGVAELVQSYKGKKGFDAGEAFDVSYDNIQSKLESGQLKNGIKYGIIRKNNRGKTVNISLALRNGNEKTLMNKGMAASYTARMLDKGSKTKTRQQIKDELSKLKSSISFRGSNGKIFTNISSTEENVMATLVLMVEILKNPIFDANELEKMKTEQLASIEQQKSEPQFLAQQRIRVINEHFAKGHPLYSMNVDEQIEAINKVSVDDLKEYYKDFYGISNNASLVAIGNIDTKQLTAFFEKEFSDFKSKNKYTPLGNPAKVNKAINESINTPDKKNAFTLGILNTQLSNYDEDYAAVQIANTIFGGGILNSRITKRLRQKDGVSYAAGAGANIDGSKDDKNSSFYVYAIYAPENYDKVQQGFKEETARFIKDGITEEELKIAVKGWVQGQNVSRAKDNELSSVINNNIFYGRDMNFHKNIEENITKLTVEKVNKVIKKYFKPFDEWTIVNAGEFKK